MKNDCDTLPHNQSRIHFDLRSLKNQLQLKKISNIFKCIKFRSKLIIFKL